MEIVTEINESLLKTQYPQREHTRNDTFDQTFWVSKIQNVWSIEFLPEIFDFLKNLVKILIKCWDSFRISQHFRKQIF
jgi:hypothetical protein